MQLGTSDNPGAWRERWADPALTVLAIELAVAIFIVAPLGVLAPGGGFALSLLLTAFVVAPVLLAAALVASRSGAALAAVFAGTALIVAGILVGLRRPSVLVTSLHLLGALLLGLALIGVVARAVSRLVTIASGLDPHGLGVPEVYWMRHSGDYRAAA